jgi:hypothetical protein
LFVRRWEQDPSWIGGRSQDSISGFSALLQVPPLVVLPPGNQWYDRTEPKSGPYQPLGSWQQSLVLTTLMSQDAFPVGRQYTERADWERRPVQPDRFWSETIIPGPLFGHDATLVGAQNFALPRGSAQPDRGFVAGLQLWLLAVPPTPIFPSVATLPAAVFRPDGFWSQNLLLGPLAGQDSLPPGSRLFGLPFAPQYLGSWIQAPNGSLLPAGFTPSNPSILRAPLFVRRWEVDPTGISRRSQDGINGFGALRGAGPIVITADSPVAVEFLLTFAPLPPGIQLFDLASAQAYPRLWRQAPNSYLVPAGLDSFFGAPGQVLNYDWALPGVRPYPADLRTWTNRLAAALSSLRVTSDTGLNLEFLAVYLADGNVPDEALLAALSDPRIANELFATDRVDPSAGLESLSFGLSDSRPALESNLGVRADPGIDAEDLAGSRGDPGVASEALSADRGAAGVSTESLLGAKGDPVVGGEFSATGVSDPGAQSESTANSRYDTGIPDEEIANQRGDETVPIEALIAERSDQGAPAEATANERADVGSIPDEILLAVRGASGSLIEFLGGVIADARLWTEILSSTIQVMADQSVALEWRSTTVADIGVLTEWVAKVTADEQIQEELLLAALGRAALWDELLSAQRGDPGANAETTANELRSAGVLAESLLRVVADGVPLRDELLSVSRTSSMASAEFLRQLLADSSLWLEIVSTAQVVAADAFIPLEILALATTDQNLTEEWVARALSDNGIQPELIAAALARAPMWDEFLAAQRGEAGAQLELAAGQLRSATVLAEFISQSAQDYLAPDEASARQQSDAGPATEIGAGAASDIGAPSEFGTAVRVDARVIFDFLSAVVVIITDALLPLEFDGTVPPGTTSAFTTRFIANMGTMMGRR